MKALFFDGNLSVREIPVPKVEPGEALIKVTTAGICATDREIAAGYMEFKGVPGHEFVGLVEDAEDPGWRGKRVVGEINAACGECEMCRAGLGRHCPSRTVLGIKGRNGAFAEYLILPVINLFPVPEKMSDREAVFTEPLAAALEIAEQVKLVPTYKTLIVGDGKLAALIAQVLKLSGLDLMVTGKSAEKLALFEKWGIPATLEKPSTKAFDLVVEASGSPDGWNTAVSLVKPRGTIVLKSTYHGDLNFNPAQLVINEITVVGSRCGRFEPALRLLEAGLIDVKSMISRVYPFDKIMGAFVFAGKPEVMKVLVEMKI